MCLRVIEDVHTDEIFLKKRRLENHGSRDDGHFGRLHDSEGYLADDPEDENGVKFIKLME